MEYGIDGQRVHMTGNIPFQEANEQIVGKVFMDDEEWLFMEGGKHIINHFVKAGGMLVAIIQKRSDSEDTEIFYPITDYLGSIIAICNKEGEIINRRSYDAWGRPRNPFSWDDYENITFKLTNRGYTMHEHMLNAGLINMNGRVYDPVIGRMLSPDNYVQDMSNPQNYNRYTYVLNNPLKYIDPSGELIEDWEDHWEIDGEGNATLIDTEGDEIYVNGKLLSEYDFSNNLEALSDIASHYYDQNFSSNKYHLLNGQVGVFNYADEFLLESFNWKEDFIPEHNLMVAWPASASKASKNNIAMFTQYGHVSSLFDNKYNLINNFAHERTHLLQNTNREGHVTELEAYNVQTLHWSWGNTTPDFKNFILGNVEKYYLRPLKRIGGDLEYRMNKRNNAMQIYNHYAPIFRSKK